MIQYDPFVTTFYLHHGKFNGRGKRNWKIFMGSLLISNGYWSLACYMGIMLFEWAWKAVSPMNLTSISFNCRLL